MTQELTVFEQIMIDGFNGMEINSHFSIQIGLANALTIIKNPKIAEAQFNKLNALEDSKRKYFMMKKIFENDNTIEEVVKMAFTYKVTEKEAQEKETTLIVDNTQPVLTFEETLIKIFNNMDINEDPSIVKGLTGALKIVKNPNLAYAQFSKLNELEDSKAKTKTMEDLADNANLDQVKSLANNILNILEQSKLKPTCDNSQLGEDKQQSFEPK